MSLVATDIHLSEYQDWEGELAAEDVDYITGELGDKLTIRRQVRGPGYILNPNQFAGVLALPSGRRLQSRPKVPLRNLFYMMAVAHNLPFRHEPAGFASFDKILEFVAFHFAGLVEERIDRGLYRSYVEREENLSTVRGRIAFAADVRHNNVLRHRTYCRYSELTWDIPENQIIRQVVHLLAGYGFRPDLRRRLGAIDTTVSEVTPTELPARALDDFRYHRLNNDYALLHAFCRLFLDGSSLREDAGPVEFRAFLIDMNALFEGFITRMLQERAGGDLSIVFGDKI